MNIRLDKHSVRIRVNSQEFQKLLDKESLYEKIMLPDSQFFEYSVHPVERRNQPMMLLIRQAQFNLEIDNSQLQSLKERLPCKDGLSYEQIVNPGSEEYSIKLVFDVDIKRAK